LDWIGKFCNLLDESQFNFIIGIRPRNIGP
jgi:hypothetical protein